MCWLVEGSGDPSIQASYRRDYGVSGSTKNLLAHERVSQRQLETRGSRVSYWVDQLFKVSYYRDPQHVHVCVYVHIPNWVCVATTGVQLQALRVHMSRSQQLGRPRIEGQLLGRASV